MGARNAGHVVGRLAADPKVFDNPGQSTKVLLTVMADRSYRNATTGERDADAVPLEAWVRAEAQSLGVYALLGRGDLVAVDYVVRSSTYADKHTGEVIYRTALVVTDVSMLESRAVTQQRRIDRLTAQLGSQTQPVHGQDGAMAAEREQDVARES